MTKKPKETPSSTKGSFTMIIIGILAFAAYLKFGTNTPETAEQEQTGLVYGYLYRYTTGIQNICNKHGIKLDNYISEFNTEFKDAREHVQARLSKIKISESLIKHQLEIDPDYQQSIADEFETEIKRDMILSLLAASKGEEVEWNDKYTNTITDAQACEIFNQTGMNYLKENNGIQEINTQYQTLKQMYM